MVRERRGERGRIAGHPRRTGSDRGAVIVEAAFAVPILVALLLGIVTVGAAYSNKISVNNAVREGARYGATVPQGQCDVAATCVNQTWAQLVRSVVIDRSDSALTTGTVCVALVSGPGSAPVAVDTAHTTAGGTAPCYADNSADSGTRVQVRATKAQRIEFVLGSKTVTMRGQAVAKFEQ